jgi:HNH endonuclease
MPSVAPGASMREEFINHKKYPPVGTCIFCGNDGGLAGLSSEHIIPFSLGGQAEILEASCVDCARITSQLELSLAREIFGELRIHANSPTRRPKRRPKILPARISVDNCVETLMLPLKDHPHFTALPVWGMPGILTGAQPTATFPDTQAHLYYYLPPNILETLKAAGRERANPPPGDINRPS